MDAIDPSNLDLAREFRARPGGPHSADLQKLLMRLRWDCPTSQYLAVQTVTGGPWYLAQMKGPRGTPIDVYTACALESADDAMWAVFRKRWEAKTGQPLVLEEDDLPDPTRTAPVSSDTLVSRPLLGYADQVSVANREVIRFKISADRAGPYSARMVRLRCGDHANLGFKYTAITAEPNGTYPGRRQAIHAGSYVDVPGQPLPAGALSLRAFVWPTMPCKGPHEGEQALMGWWDHAAGAGLVLFLDPEGRLSLRVGDGREQQQLHTGVSLRERSWYEVAASFGDDLWVGQRPLASYARDHTAGDATTACSVGRIDLPGPEGSPMSFRIAAWTADSTVLDNFGRPVAAAHFNGKIEAPMVASRALSAAERVAFRSGEFEGLERQALLGHWDFSRNMSSTEVVDVSGKGHHGYTVNLPTRAMKGVQWDGSEYNFAHAPAHYGAIHFHDDDLYDCGWRTDFEWQIPDDLPSGLYCAHLEQAGGEDHDSVEDWVPFVVRPPRGTTRAALALLLPTAAYWAYANRQQVITYEGREHVRAGFVLADSTALFLHHHPEYGLSTYDEHSDGSGVCYSSRLRPVLSMRPREALWQLPADTHIIDWLEEKRIAFDIITEDDLDAEGVSLLAGYRCVMTGTHPEYPSKTMIDAFAEYQRQGGRFMYLGGNGFYWRVSYHPDLPGVMEMRRAEDGIRAWLAEGGEYYHGFTGELGGMWRRMGHAPQTVAGTGMTAQGFDMSTYYRRTAASHDPRAAFIFEGVGPDERIGDFGIIGGGAAGSEIDRADVSLGTPAHALVVATADTFSPGYHWMKEELTHTHAAITGDVCPYVHCDMVFYETDNGGAVFSSSSIAWAGALAHDHYQNNVSRITENVVRRFLDPEPF